ncbi:MAG TPA: tRNA guanosine(34) transglycosylase Tgt, partial [Thermoanaerobaculia bacterium]|nr:tRNA guanosine(34) transglycosylase Tgt [Thermoanaerobaculia bacterium]
MKFEVLARDGAARRGELTTSHGRIQTPVFMPVGTLASVKSLTTEQLRALGPENGPEIMLCNTYHLMLRPGVDLLEQLGGVHRFMSWDRAVLTDSGGFQLFSLASIRKIKEEGVEFRSHLDGSPYFLSPERSIEIQARMGVDIAMAFDECPSYELGHDEVAKSMALTHRWAARSLAARNAFVGDRRSAISDQQDGAGSGPIADRPSLIAQPPALFGIVQGGIHLDLRRQSAEVISSMDFDGIAIGGVSVG